LLIARTMIEQDWRPWLPLHVQDRQGSVDQLQAAEDRRPKAELPTGSPWC
jgi:hypothetical protein